MRFEEALCVAVAVLVSVGCGREEGKAPPTSSIGIYEDAFRIGKSASVDGVATAETNVFIQGDSIHASFVVQNAPVGAKARAVWTKIAEGNIGVAKEEKALGKKGFVSFHVADTSKWEPGNYRLVKILIGDPSNLAGVTNLGSMDIKILPRR